MKSKINSIFLVLTLMVLLINCTPSNPTAPSGNSSSPQPKMQFKANGVLYNFDAIYDSRLGWTEYPELQKDSGYSTGVGSIITYTLRGHDLSDNFINLFLPINQQPYVGTTNSTSSDCHFIGVGYSGGSHTIVITTINQSSLGFFNSTVSGTFSGSVVSNYNPNTPNPTVINITEGTFENIPFTN